MTAQSDVIQVGDRRWYPAAGAFVAGALIGSAIANSNRYYGGYYDGGYYNSYYGGGYYPRRYYATAPTTHAPTTPTTINGGSTIGHEAPFTDRVTVTAIATPTTVRATTTTSPARRDCRKQEGAETVKLRNQTRPRAGIFV